MKRVVVLLSGTGSNLQAILDASRGEDLGYEVVGVLSNRSKALGLEKAKAAGVARAFVDPRPSPDRESYDRELAAALDEFSPDLIVLAGFMRILSPYFVRRYAGKVVNIHPSLLPAFPGKDPQAQAISAGASQSGVTIHEVDEGVDTGPIIAQERVDVALGETATSLAKKIQRIEHRLYPRVIGEICARLGTQGRIGGTP